MQLPKNLVNSLPDLTLFGSIAASYLLDRFVPITHIIPTPLSFLGWVIAAIGAIGIVRILSIMRLQHASTDVVVVSQILLQKGPFAFSRNPLYIAYVFTTIGLAMVFGSVSALIPPILGAIILSIYIVPREERDLRRKFGATYDQYARRVRRWL